MTELVHSLEGLTVFRRNREIRVSHRKTPWVRTAVGERHVFTSPDRRRIITLKAVGPDGIEVVPNPDESR